MVLSPSFFAKSWTQLELNGLFAREVRGKSTIIPVWYNVTIEEVTEFSPILADRVALDSAILDVEDIAMFIGNIVRGQRHG